MALLLAWMLPLLPGQQHPIWPHLRTPCVLVLSGISQLGSEADWGAVRGLPASLGGQQCEGLGPTTWPEPSGPQEPIAHSPLWLSRLDSGVAAKTMVTGALGTEVMRLHIAQ